MGCHATARQQITICFCNEKQLMSCGITSLQFTLVGTPIKIPTQVDADQKKKQNFIDPTHPKKIIQPINNSISGSEALKFSFLPSQREQNWFSP